MENLYTVLLLLASLAFSSSHGLFFLPRTPCEKANPNRPSFTVPQNSTLLRLMRFSAASYVKKEMGTVLETWTCDLCRDNLSDFQLRRVSSDDVLETLAYTGYDPTLRAILVVFRGTLTPLNWLNNFDFFKKRADIFPVEAGKVHGGFLRMYKSLRQNVLADVQSLIAEHSTSEVYVTGHSLGGAMAVMGSLDIRQSHPTKSPIMISFAAPLVGDDCFVNYYTNRIQSSLRVVNGRDPVPLVPPFWLGFSHVHQEFVVSNSPLHGTYLGVSVAEILIDNISPRKRRSANLIAAVSRKLQAHRNVGFAHWS